MSRLTRVVIVGGGTAGWITANVIAAEHRRGAEAGVEVVLVESPDIPTVGVGEGTWPSMRSTLGRVGLDEDHFLRACNASFKQGTRFCGWSGNGGPDEYLHPFSLPVEYSSLNPARHWLAERPRSPFAAAVTPQAAVVERGLAPKQEKTPQYAFAFNYGYHLDAGRFAALLHRHGTRELGVTHIAANVKQVVAAEDGDIEAVLLDTGRRLGGDLFVDCTGARALLLGEHYGVRSKSVKRLLFNDTALAVQVPYARADAAIASTTRATATPAGWVWDIGLQSRRGVGLVYSSAHSRPDEADDALRRYVQTTSPGVKTDSLEARTIRFEPGHRETFWHRNCVAVGLSAGFVEPLEASALALIEQSAAAIAEALPRDRSIMDAVARRFNAKMSYHWQRIVEFLKLHYVVGYRDGRYWRDHRAQDSIPSGLADKLALWRQQPPWHEDAPRLDELFPSASYQYVLYGLGFRPQYQGTPAAADLAGRAFQETRDRARQAVRLLPTNRTLLDRITSRAPGCQTSTASERHG